MLLALATRNPYVRLSSLFIGVALFSLGHQWRRHVHILRRMADGTFSRIQVKVRIYKQDVIAYV